MSEDDQRAIVRRFVEDIWNTGDVAVADGLVAPTYRVHSPYQNLRDRAAFTAWLGAFRAAFPDARWTVEDTVVEGDKVAARLTFSATHAREFMGVAPTGRALTATEQHIFRLDGGRVVEQWALPDNLTLLQQIGALPPLTEQPPRAVEVRMPAGTRPADRFDTFTERARNVLTLAQEEATQCNHNYIGTEHLLLGLVREGEGVAAKVLANLGVELNRVRSAVEFIIGRGDRMIVGEVSLTPRAKTVIALAVDEARRLGHHYIGTEHLLLGLVREGEGIAASVLESLGVTLEQARSQTSQVLGSASQPLSATATPGEPVTPATASHPRWEYMTVQVSYADPHGEGLVARINGRSDDPRFGRGTTPIPLHEALRLLGADRWELVGIDTPAADTLRHASYVFKRPLAEG